MTLLLSSITQTTKPPPTNKRKRIRYVAAQVHEKSMENLSTEVRSSLEAPLKEQTLLACSKKLQAEYRASLHSSNTSMLPSYQHTLPTGRERGNFLALDVGGSTFRIALIRLNGKKNDSDGLQVRRVRSFAINEEVRRLGGREFFDWMAERIGDMLAEYNYMAGTVNARLQMGLAWSFPVDHTSLRTARLSAMGKGFHAAKDLEGQDLGELIMCACHARGLNVELCAIVNDGAAALLSQAYRDPATRMSLILGTGINVAAYLPTSALGKGKFGARDDEWHKAATRVVVNTEMSMFGKEVWPTTRWDDKLNAEHSLPDFQPLEYLVAGRYLGEMVRIIMIEAISTAGLFEGHVPDGLSEPYTFDTRTLAIFQKDQTAQMEEASAALLSAHPLPITPNLQELQFIRDTSSMVATRAAAYVATAIHALWVVRTASEDFQSEQGSQITVACDGSMVEKYPGFRQLAQRYLDRLCRLTGAMEGSVTLDMASESSIFGAAVSAATE